MKKRKICVVITARPSYSRIKTVLQAIKDHDNLTLQLVVAASALLDRYGTTVNYIEEDGFKVIAKVFNILEGENLSTASKSTGIGIIELASVFENIQPDIVITIADRFETMATAIAASYGNIPLAHIQGGEVTGNIDEKVRHAITKLSDYHFVASEDANKRVIRLGENQAFVFDTGCPSIDIAKNIYENPKINFDVFKKYSGVGKKFNISEEYLVVLQHPVTTEYKSSQKHILESLKAVNEIGFPTFWFWPNVDAGSDGTSKGIRLFREKNKNSNIYFLKNMEPSDFLNLIYFSKVLIGNSSVGIRESSYLGVPVVNIGNRQNRRLRGKNVIDAECNKKNIVKAIKQQLSNGRFPSSHIYGNGKSGIKIAEILTKVELKFHKTIEY
jgi:UDP-hydrolysing UDP-N-acetyl-D-glucosamine 2-epimerase